MIQSTIVVCSKDGRHLKLLTPIDQRFPGTSVARFRAPRRFWGEGMFVPRHRRTAWAL